jgi:two-component system chemotaxis response regulator CheB
MIGSRPPVRLLIVDQSPGARDKLRRLFETKEDIEVVGDVGTAQKALRQLEDSSPTAVLIDCEMPGAGSFCLVKEMMALYRVPIVMLTKQSKIVPKALEQKALEAGAVAIAALTLEGLAADKTSQ